MYATCKYDTSTYLMCVFNHVNSDNLDSFLLGSAAVNFHTDHKHERKPNRPRTIWSVKYKETKETNLCTLRVTCRKKIKPAFNLPLAVECSLVHPSKTKEIPSLILVSNSLLLLLVRHLLLVAWHLLLVVVVSVVFSPSFPRLGCSEAEDAPNLAWAAAEPVHISTRTHPCPASFKG